MARFEGTLKEFHDYIGPRIRNKIQSITQNVRKSKNGICEHCHEKNVLESAHIHKNNRRSIIERILESFIIDGIVICILEDIEQEIVKDHYPIEDNFLFLCKKCHANYDAPLREARKSNKSVTTKRKSILSKNNNVEENNFPYLHRIALWSKRPHQINYKIIEAFLDLSCKNSLISKSLLENVCSEKIGKKKFEDNYNQMTTNKGKPHGMIFFEQEGNVFMYPEVEKEIKKYFS